MLIFCIFVFVFVGSSSADSRDLDYESMDEEHRRLLKTIKQAQSDTLQEPKESVTLRVQVPDRMQEIEMEEEE